MIAPAPIAELLASSRFEEVHKAVTENLARLLPGVSIVRHPGKLDMNDILRKDVVAAPGVALGWGRLRGTRDVGGSYGVPIDFVAYVLAEDYADRSATPPRVVKRDVLAVAIGMRILRILADPDTASWGLTGITAPMPDPEPEMRPIFTLKTAENGTALYAVTWTQWLVDQGASFFGGPTPEVRPAPEGQGLPDGMVFDVPEGDLPTELLALIGGGGTP